MIKLKQQVGASFKPTVITPNGKIEYPEAKNLLLNSFFANVSTEVGYLHVGTGTVDPIASDTALTSFVASVAMVSGTSAKSHSWDELGTGLVTTSVTGTWVFPLGAVDAVLGELGLSTSSSNGYCVTKALFKDAQGDPITVPVTALDQLVIEYTVSWVYDPYPAPVVVDAAGVPTTLTTVLARLDANTELYTLSLGIRDSPFDSYGKHCAYGTDIFIQNIVNPVDPLSQFTGSLFNQTGQREYEDAWSIDSTTGTSSASSTQGWEMSPVEDLVDPISCYVASISPSTSWMNTISNVKAVIYIDPPIDKDTSHSLEMGFIKEVSRL